MSDRDAAPIPTRAELMERIEAGWAALDKTLIDLDASQIALRPAPGEWSIKDHLAHIAVWLTSAVALVQGKSRPDAMGVSETIWATADEDEINAEIEQLWLDRAPADVLATLRTAQAELRELISAMEDEDLAKPYSHFQSGDGARNANPVVGWIIGDTFSHVDAHLPAIHALRDQVG